MRELDEETPMRDESDFKMDKTAFSVEPLSEADEQDKAYWLSQTPHDRLRALELTRQAMYGYDPATTRIKKVFEVVKLKDLK